MVYMCACVCMASLVAELIKNLPAMQETGFDLIPGLGRSPGEGDGNPLQYSCLENPTEEPGRLQSMGHKSWVQLSD